MDDVGHQSTHTGQVVIGVDTHKDEHVAVAIDRQGVRLGERHLLATTYGYRELELWCRSLGETHAFGIEGTGSYGAGVARYLIARGYTVVEVNRPDRSVRYLKGKSDPTDAEMAARAVLAGVADATPKSGEGEVEMIRMLKIARDSAVKARTQAVNQMKALVITAPAGLRETLDNLATGDLVTRCNGFRPGRPDNPTAAVKYALRSLASRYRHLSPNPPMRSGLGVGTRGEGRGTRRSALDSDKWGRWRPLVVVGGADGGPVQRRWRGVGGTACRGRQSRTGPVRLCGVVG